MALPKVCGNRHQVALEADEFLGLGYTIQPRLVALYLRTPPSQNSCRSAGIALYRYAIWEICYP